MAWKTWSSSATSWVNESIETLEGKDWRTPAEIEVQEKKLEVWKKIRDESETYANLENKIPKELFSSVEDNNEKPIPLDNNKKLLSRIVTKIENYVVDKKKFIASLAKNGENLLWYSKIEEIPHWEYDTVIQKLAILEACNGDFINLPDNQRQYLAKLLFPAISRQKLNLSWNSESIEVVKENSKVKDYPGYPYIERMLLNGDITQEDFNIFIEEFKKSENIGGISLGKISPAIIAIIERIQYDEDAIKEMNKQSFLASFWSHKGTDWVDLSERIEYTPAIRLIAENYMEIPINSNSQLDPKTDFYTAVDVASNKIRWWVKNINTSSERYKKAIAATKSIDINTQIHWISELLAIKWIYEWWPVLTVKNRENEITKLLQESDKNAREWHLYKKEKVKEARLEESNSLENDWNPDDILEGWPPRAANDQYYDGASASPLQSWSKWLESINTDNDNQRE